MRAVMRQAVVALAGAVALGLVAAGGAWAQDTGLTSILQTKHNLSTSGTGAIHVTSGTGEVCVFCHTPHGADTTVAAPLWNRAINTSGGYTLYNSPTLDALPTQPSGVSLACLSCHDGTIAFDALRNLPGSGGFTETPSADGTSNWTFTGATNKKMPVGITLLGTDLSNDHPISMTYTDARSPSSTVGDGSTAYTVGFKPVLAGDLIGTGGVRLYTGKVQCASCHDPHRANTQTFLRVDNTGSALCLTCHKKDG